MGEAEGCAGLGGVGGEDLAVERGGQGDEGLDEDDAERGAGERGIEAERALAAGDLPGGERAAVYCVGTLCVL